MHELRSSGSQNAFPVHSPELGEWRPGIDVLDYFAAKALEGAMANPNLKMPGNTPPEEVARKVASAAYTFADAMIAERDRRAAS